MAKASSAHQQSLRERACRPLQIAGLATAILTACAPAEEPSGTARSAEISATEGDALAPVDAGTAGGFFGGAIELAGDELYVGAPFAPLPAGRGAVQPYVRGEPGWIPGPLLSASDGEDGDRFGESIALSGDTLIVGAPGKSGGVGAAYVFVRDGDGWVEQAKLLPSNAGPDALFGRHVRLSGDLAVVSAHRDDEFGVYSGSVRVFRRTLGTWSETDVLYPPSHASGTFFGVSLAFSENLLLVGASSAGPAAQGEVHAFSWNGSEWVLVYTFLEPGDAEDAFGRSVAVGGDTVLIGAAHSGAAHKGAVFVYSAMGGAWPLEATLTDDAVTSEGGFGVDVALSGGLAVVGASGDAAAGLAAGALYAFRRNKGEWGAPIRLTSSLSTGGDWLGYAVAAQGPEVLGGAPKADSPYVDAGAVYTFHVVADTGDSCSEGGECATGFCVDGVCCDKPCQEPGLACSAEAKGEGEDGVCGPIVAGQGGGGSGGGGSGGSGGSTESTAAGGGGSGGSTSTASGTTTSTGHGGAAGEPGDERSYYSCGAAPRQPSSGATMLFLAIGAFLRALRRRARDKNTIS